MRRSRWVLLIACQMAILALAAVAIDVPGYLDADYYFATGLTLARGEGFSEPFLWNYLDGIYRLPHPSHLYWMPLTSLLSAAGIAIGGEHFRSAQLVFLLLAGALPVLTFLTARHLGLREDQAGWAAVLAIFPGWYLPYLLTTETFAPFALAGGLALVFIHRGMDPERGPGAWALAGVIIGLGHLTRVDGVLLLLVAFLAALWRSKGRRVALVALIVGYLFVMGPWAIRMWLVTGTPASSAGTRLLWATTYDELFVFPAERLTPDRWLAAGAGVHVRHRLQALGQNLQSLLAVNGLVFLTPWILLSGYRHRRIPLVRLAGGYLLLLLGVMSFAFPYAGVRGGFFHSSVALMPVAWALAVDGLWIAVRWAAKRRGWDSQAACLGFTRLAVLLSFGLTAWLYVQRVIGEQIAAPVWKEERRMHLAIAISLDELDPQFQPVGINNPAGFYLASGRQAVVVPHAGVDVLRGVAQVFQLGAIVLDTNAPVDLRPVYDGEEHLAWVETVVRLERVPRQPVIFVLRGQGSDDDAP
jgi:4-amino-4-deoxy-L-arabinose transferase-like glycosyltransferase